METIKTDIDYTQISSTCESDEEIPQYPPRTKLYSLEPCGLGTAMVESLSGYVAGVAAEHSTRVGDLVGRVLSGIENPYGEVLPPCRLRRAATTSHHGFTQFNYTVNGANGTAERMVFALEVSTGRRDLRGLTFLGYKPVLGAFRFHKTRRWCPQCLAEWQMSHQRLYEPLLWTCATTLTCSIHRCPLAKICPKCRRTVGPLTVGACIGYCDHCGAWLGQADELENDSADRIDKEALWNQEQVICLIRHMPDVQRQTSTSSWSSNLRILIEATTNGSINAFARNVRLDIATVEGWLEAKCIPKVDSAMRISRALGIDLWSLVNDSPLSDYELTTARESRAKSDLQFQRRQREADRISAELARSLSSPDPETLTTLTGRLGLTNRCRLYSTDRKATLAIAERRLKSRGTRSDRTFDKASARRTLIREIASKHPRSVGWVATELGFAQATLEHHLPELCKRLVRRRKQLQERERAAAVRELNRALEETPPPTMIELSARLGYGPQTLKSWAPDVCRQIAERRSDSHRVERIRIENGLKSMLSENPPPAITDVFHRLDTNFIFVKKYFPELLADLQEKRRLYQVELKQARMESLVRAVRDVVNEIIAKGLHISRAEVTVRIPAHLQRMGWIAIDRAIAEVRENP